MVAGKAGLTANQNGFSYILVLTVVMIMGIMLGLVGQSWKTIKQRELEEEMIFRGDQIAEVVYQRLKCKNAVLPPKDANFYWLITSPNGTILDDLVTGKDESCKGTTKKLRIRPSAILDPMTNKKWNIESPVGYADRFAGVKSESTEKPFKQSFKNIYDSEQLDGKQKYSEWLFTWELKNPAIIQSVNKTP